MEKQTKPKPLGLSMAKVILAVAIIVFIGTVLGVAGYFLIKPKAPIQKEISAIEISTDKKSILNAETKEVIFTIEDAKKYLKDSGYEYNPNTFQTTNAKYAGDCFGDAKISNKKDSIIFSTSCLSNNSSEAWIGNFYIYGSYYKGIRIGKNPLSDKINFIISGSGKNFAWSADDKTITYEADLGLSGIMEIRTIDSRTGEILERENQGEIDTSNWKTYSNEEYGFEIKYPNNIFQLDSTKNALSHALKNFHKYSEKDGSDLGLANDMFIVFGKEKEVDKCDYLEQTIKEIALPFEFKNIKGLKYETGAEGEGVIYYCVRNDANKTIFLIERWFLNEEHSLELPKQKDYIPSEEQERIFNQILSTFKFIEKEE